MWVVEITPMKMVLGIIWDSMGWFMALGLPHHRIFLQSTCLPTALAEGQCPILRQTTSSGHRVLTHYANQKDPSYSLVIRSMAWEGLPVELPSGKLT